MDRGPGVWAAGLPGRGFGEGVLPPRVRTGGLPGPLPSSHTQDWQAHSRRSHARAENSLPLPHLFLIQAGGGVPLGQAVRSLRGDQHHRGLPEIPEVREKAGSWPKQTDYIQL